MSTVSLDDLMHEKDVEQKYGKILADRELREARQAGLIGWYDLRKGPHYTTKQVMDYLALREKKPCKTEPDVNKPLVPEPVKPSASSSSAATGSGRSPAAAPSPIIGMTRALEERAARALDAEA